MHWDSNVSSGSVLAVLSAVVSCQNLASFRGKPPVSNEKTAGIIEYSTLTVVVYWDSYKKASSMLAIDV